MDGEQRQTAQADASQDGRATDELLGIHRVPEGNRARHRADQRLQVQEGPGHLGGYPDLPVGEQRERQHRTAERKSGEGQEGARAARPGRHPLADRGHRQHGRGGSQELHRRHRDRVAAAQQPGLRDGERRRYQQRHQYQAIAADTGPGARSACDQADTCQRQEEARPGHRPRHRAAPDGRDDRHQHRRRANQQGRMTHAGLADARVLHQDRPAVTHRAPSQHGRRAGGAQPAPSHDHEDDGGHAEPREREPGRGQPLQRHLGQRHGGTPQQPGSAQRGDGAAKVGVHDSISPTTRREFVIYTSLLNNVS